MLCLATNHTLKMFVLVVKYREREREASHNTNAKLAVALNDHLVTEMRRLVSKHVSNTQS